MILRLVRDPPSLQAKESLLAAFEALSLDEQHSIIPQKPWKVSLSAGNGSTTGIVDLTQDDAKPEKPKGKGQSGGEENDKVCCSFALVNTSQHRLVAGEKAES